MNIVHQFNSTLKIVISERIKTAIFLFPDPNSRIRVDKKFHRKTFPSKAKQDDDLYKNGNKSDAIQIVHFRSKIKSI